MGMCDLGFRVILMGNNDYMIFTMKQLTKWVHDQSRCSLKLIYFFINGTDKLELTFNLYFLILRCVLNSVSKLCQI